MANEIAMNQLMTKTLLLLSLALPLAASAQQTTQQGVGDTIPDFVRRAASEHPQPGDRVWLHVWREQKLSDTVMVDERGEVMLPKIGIVKASALTIGEFRDTVRTRFAEFFRDSPIELVVLRRVAVNGEVAKPNVYYVDVTTTLRDVIARAGGITDAGSAKKVTIIRDGRRIAVPGWQQDRSASSDLRSGDQVVVGRKSWIAMNALPALSVTTVVASLIISLARR
jgi:protein involved in polysaccharide export with SLBB domain